MFEVVNNLKRLFNGAPAEREYEPFRSSHFLSHISPTALSELLVTSQQNNFLSLLPNLEGKKSLYISSPGTEALLENILQMNPHRVLNYQLSAQSIVQDSRVISVTGNFQLPALKKSIFDLAFFPMAGLNHSDCLSAMRNMIDTLDNQGRVLLCIVHPTLFFLLMNQASFHATQGFAYTLQNILLKLKEMDLYIEALHEGYVDREVKAYFEDAVGQNYHEEYQGLPLTLVIRAVKFVRNS